MYSERRKAEATQSRLAAIVASSNDAIISKNIDGIITQWNNEAKKMFGYTAKEAIGKHISIIIPPEFREEEEVIISNLRKGKHIDCETTRLRKDGKIFFVSLTISPIKDKEGNIIGASKIARDISLRKQAEKKQQFLNKMSDLLTNSIDQHITFTAIVKLIVPALADYCRIAVVDEKKQIKEIVLNHRNRGKMQLTKDLYDIYSNQPESTLGIKHILQTGKPEILSEITDSVLEKFGTAEKVTSIVKKIDLRSYMGVPLRVRGKTIGAITFSSINADRIYTHEDLLFVQDVASRIALVLDNERLYKEAIDEIRHRKKAEEMLQDREQRIRTIWESASDAISVSDKQGKVLAVNPAYYQLYGYKPEDVLQKNFAIIFPKEQRQYAIEQYRTLFKSENIIPFFESSIRKADGSHRIVESRYGFIMQGDKREAMVSIIRDITERKELEQRKNEFISIASHELKTPVTSLKAYAQVLERRFLKANDQQSAGHLAKMNTQLNKLTNLIADLLDISKIESGKIQFHEELFFIDELMSEIVEEVQRTTEKHVISIRGKANKKLYGNRDRIGQVLTNLITNAIKYSPHTKKIIMKSSSDNKNVTVCIQDFGVGIPQEEQRKVFERFYRVSGPKEDTFPGLGLGLYISSEIIKRQNGRIWVESVAGKGSTFYFTLPIRSQ